MIDGDFRMKHSLSAHLDSDTSCHKTDPQTGLPLYIETFYLVLNWIQILVN